MKALTWETYILAGGIQKYEACHSLKLNIPKTLKYTLTEMTLTRKEFQVITATILNYGLPRAVLSSTIHTAVRYGPSLLGGITLMDLLLKQGTGRIELLIEHS